MRSSPWTVHPAWCLGLMLSFLVPLLDVQPRLAVPRWQSGEPRQGGATVILQSAVVGQTTTYIGATEAAGFWIDDLTDLGINTYRLWTKMAELEWWDDDDAAGGYWDGRQIGKPTITQIRDDAGNGFANTIPWTWWDERFDEVWLWRYGVQTRRGIIEALVQNDIAPLVVLRTYDDQGEPEMREDVEWAPRPPMNGNFDEWWEHCFAIAYWLNVRNDYGVTHFQVLNEPDYNCQGWCNISCPGFLGSFCGTQADYAELVLYAYDAISYANSFVELPTYIHAPVVANYGNAYVPNTLDNADSAVQVVDYHSYAADLEPGIAHLGSTISAHNPDGILEPIWNSEWGALWDTYDTVERAMLTANQLLTFSEQGVEGVTIFNMYDWSTAPGEDWGLVDMQDDGAGGATRSRTETYYAYRLMVRGLVGGKERLGYTASDLDAQTRLMATRDGDFIHILVLQNNVATPASLTVDYSALGIDSGSATVYEYSAAYKDEPVGSLSIVNGCINFTPPANGISLVTTQQPTAVDVVFFAATLGPAGIELFWETANEMEILGFHLHRARAPDGERLRVNEQVIQAKAPGEARGATYRYLDTTAEGGNAYEYWLEVLDTTLNSDMYGPVVVFRPFYACLPLTRR